LDSSATTSDKLPDRVEIINHSVRAIGKLDLPDLDLHVKNAAHDLFSFHLLGAELET
jgi:hypothetical protein